MEEIIRIIMEAVATGVGVLVILLIRKIAKKYDLEVELFNSHKIQSCIERLVLNVEEEANQYLKRTGKKRKSWEKLHKVLNEAYELFPEETRENLEKRVNAVLINNKIGATISAPKVWPKVAEKPPED